MKNTAKNITAILDDMRKITMLTGEISSVHEQSLKKWPYIVFDDVEDVEIKYDLSKESQKDNKGNVVDFFISLPSEDISGIQNFDSRCENMVLWVRDMFWQDIEVNIHINGLLEYKNSENIKEEKSGLEQN